MSTSNGKLGEHGVMKVLAFFHKDVGLQGILPVCPQQIVGGDHRRFMEIAKRIGKHGVEFVVVESYPTYLAVDSGLHYRCEPYVTPALSFGDWRLTDPWLIALEMARIGKSLAKKEHFDLILSPGESVPMSLAAFLTSHSAKIPWIVVVQYLDWRKVRLHGSCRRHFIEFYSNAHTTLDKNLLLYLFNHGSIISVSHAMEKQLRDLGVRSKVFICGNGVDISLIDEVPTRSLLFDGIFVGRLVSDKGISETLRIFQEICRKNTEAKFAFIGGGDADTIQALRREIVKRNIEKNVSLLGYVGERERLFELMKRSKVFIYPTHLESWGTVVGEALACGLPVICYDLPAFKELFSCEAVRVCEEGNVDQMIAETERLIQDSAERNRLGRIGRDYVKRYTWDEVAGKEAQIFRLVAE